MMTIWRAVDQKGLGVFRSNILDNFIGKYAAEKYPSIMDEFGSNLIYAIPANIPIRVGCVSLEQFNHWFGEEAVLNTLSRAGAYLLEYEVPDSGCLVGEYQAIFAIDAAILKEKYDISELPELLERE